jgi:hypothetical protein
LWRTDGTFTYDPPGIRQLAADTGAELKQAAALTKPMRTFTYDPPGIRQLAADTGAELKQAN